MNSAADRRTVGGDCPQANWLHCVISPRAGRRDLPMSELVAAPYARRPAWEGGDDETKPAGHGQRRAQATERAPAPPSAVVFRPYGRLPGADPAGLEPGSAVVDDGSRGHVGRRCSAPTDRGGHRQLGRGPLTTSVAVVMCPGADQEANRPTTGISARCACAPASR